MNLIDIINNGPFDQLGTVLDVDMMLRYGAFNSVLVNLDSYTGNGHNYDLYEQDGVFTVIPWDLNEAFGNFNCGCDQDALIDFYIDEPSCGPIDSRPLINAALSTSGGLDKYHDILSEMLAGSFNPETMAPWLTETADLIRPDLQMGGGPGGGTTMGLESFVEDRYEAISKQLSGSQPSTNNGQGHCGGGGPGPGKPDGNNPKCPDGICDAFEQANPDVCPEDCQ
jgi:spore coat protein CotH